MSEIIKAIVLGIVQGATEFIPVSSSGHLVIVPWLLGWPPSSLLFDAILHWGTLLAILLIFRQDFTGMIRSVLRSITTKTLDDEARLAWLIVIGTLPAMAIGFLFEDRVEAIFLSSSAPLVAGISLIITAGLLAGSEQLTHRLSNPHELPSMNQRDALTIGCAQVIALLPGVSRSGSTIAAGLTRNLRREAAARFSFLLGAPVFFGAGLLQLVDALSGNTSGTIETIPALLVGFVVSAITGFIAIRFLLAYLRTNNLYAFATYCLLAGCIVIGLVFLGF